MFYKKVKRICCLIVVLFAIISNVVFISAMYEDELVLASMSGNFNDVYYFVSSGTNVKSYSGSKALIFSIARGYLDIAKFLINQGADVNAKEPYNEFYEGKTALMCAVKNGYADITELLLKRGAKVNQQTSKGETALSFALQKNFTDIIKILIKYGADDAIIKNNYLNDTCLCSNITYEE